jgi:nucleoside-diphosphate-sugar epimerase
MSGETAADLDIRKDDVVLVTGAAGFIGARVVQNLLDRGFRRIRCLVRPSTAAAKVVDLLKLASGNELEVIKGDLLSREDCLTAARGASVVYHLAAGRGQKSFPDAYLNSVVTTRNLLDACVQHACLQRFVNVGSFVVYTNKGKPQAGMLDETCPVEQHGDARAEAYCFAKCKQDELVAQYGREFGIPYVIVRPGVVYGPGNLALTGRVGIDSFGIFLHLGGSAIIPLCYVDNCAEAIVLAGLKAGIDGEVFNVVDDDLGSSRHLLRLYKRHVRRFKSVYIPKPVSYALCWLWEIYSRKSGEQLPPVFNRLRWNALWKKTRYSNAKLKQRLGWSPVVSTPEAERRYFAACREAIPHA